MNVREVRESLREVLDRVRDGEEISILRRGEEVARLVPPSREATAVADLSAQRDALVVKGETPSQALAALRAEAR